MTTTRTTDQAERLHRIDALAGGFRARARALDDAAALPAENLAELRAAGLLALTAPVEFGGDGMWWDGRYGEYYELIEHLARIDSTTAQLLQVHSHALGILSRLGSDEQRRRHLPDIVAQGKLLASVGSEANPSGKLADISRAELEERPDGWHLTANKYFASLAPGADELLIWTAVPGAGPFQDRAIIALVPRTAPEVELIDQWDVLGMRATVSWSVKVSDYIVPADRLIGEPGAWMRSDPRTFTLAFAANHIGAAGNALDFVTGWVRERPDLAGSEVTRVALGAMSSDLFAVRSAMTAAAALWDGGDHDAAELASIRTLHEAKRVALDISQRAFDICGARATFRNHAIERIFRDIRTFTLHFRDEQYMHQVGQAMLDGEFHAKGYAGASTFPESQPRA
ncbi:MAG: acyl-CoA dehydrogenase family protein [Solirubrobacterales bacterium]